jgi:helix-turn-helix protein
MALPRLLTDDEAAAFLGQKKNTLACWRSYGTGPEFIRVGRRVFYTEQSLQSFLRKRTKRRTSQTGKAKAA